MKTKKVTPATRTEAKGKSLISKSKGKVTKKPRLDKILTENLGGCILTREAEHVMLLQRYQTIFAGAFLQALSKGKIAIKNVNISDFWKITDCMENLILDAEAYKSDSIGEPEEIRRIRASWRV